MVTPLARNLLLAGCTTVVAAAAGAVTGWLKTSTMGLLSLVIAVWATPAPPDRKMTTMDRFLVNVQRVVQGKLQFGHIATVLRFESGVLPDAKTAKEWMSKVAVAYPRFGSVAVPASLVEFSAWKRCQDMDWDYHIVTHPAVQSEAELRAKVNEIINTKLNFSKPPWCVDIVPNGAGDGAVVWRLDHCMGDGLRLVKAAGGFMTFEDGSPAELAILKVLSKKKLDASTHMGKGPSFVLKVVKDLFKVLAMEKLPAEDPSCFHSPKTTFIVPCKYATVKSSVSLSDLKAIKEKCPAGTTLNDVVLTAFCGALRRYSEACAGESLKADQLMRAFCAVAMPDLRGRAAEDCYNNFVMPSLELPVGVASRGARLLKARETMNQLKVSLTGPITEWLSCLLGRLGLDALAGETQLKIFPLHSFVYSNVPGFDRPTFLFGGKNKIKSFESYYPNMISQTLFLSYCNVLTFSLTTDPTVVSKPQALVDAFAEEVSVWHKEMCS